MPNVYQFKDFTGSSHRILLSLIRRAPKGAVMVDLGAAGGELGASLADRFTRRVGFEYDAARLPQLAKAFDSSAIVDLEAMEALPRDADVVILADVLEHLRHQKPLLELVHRSLKRDGRLYVSVPNIANVTIRIGLLFGVFRYRERGILDETHVRFYTLRSIREELETSGFTILEVHGSSVPIRLILGGRLPEPLLKGAELALLLFTRMWKSLMAYQIILVAAPTGDPATPHT